ncbi:MAG: hypothetical protein M3N53_08030 [Actinomycetota bacterium]|nr:hypothetical protein [Actinomycetota bacterium]
MLVDGEIRTRVVVLGESLNDDVDTALADVMRGASSRRRRVLITRIAVVALFAATIAGAWFGSVGTYLEAEKRLQPADRTDGRDSRDPESQERLEMHEDRRERAEGRNEGSAPGSGSESLRGHGSPNSPRVGPSGSSDSAPRQLENERARGGVRADPLRQSHDEVSHSASSPYQMPVVRPRVDPRHRCFVDGEGCAWFETQPGDRFVSVSIHDESGSDVLVRIVQWEHDQRTLGDPTIFCGGQSDKVKILPATDYVMVEIENGNCPDGRETAPSGGQMEVVFFRG